MSDTSPKNHQSGDNLRFRQTRFAENADRLSFTAGGRQAIVKNWSRTGIAFQLEVEPPLRVGDTLENVKIRCGEIPIHEGTVQIRSVREGNPGGYLYGASFAKDLFLVDGISSAIAAQEFVNTLRASTSAVEEIKPEVCQSLLAIRRALGMIQRFCVETERNWRNMSFDGRCEAERTLVPYLSRQITELFSYFNMKVAKQVDIDTLGEGSAYHQLFAEEASPRFEAGDFPRRAINKPRGYAGDYEMMNQLYRGGYEGIDLYGRIINYYVANEAAGSSVRFRRDYFLRHFGELFEHFSRPAVLSVACGPAVEIQEFCRRSSAKELERVAFTLFDLDREALEHAQTKIFEVAMKGNKTVNVEFINASVKAFLSSQVELKKRFEFIYSAGLFDYLDNLTSASLVRHFSRMLSPGGRLVIGNFTKANPTKAFCHLILNWNLVHKTEEEITSWAEGIDDCDLSLDFDPQRINAFLVLTKRNAPS